MQLTDIDTKQLAAFLAIHEHRSFGKAATALGYSQAAVSQQIANLERTAGLALFERPGGPRPVIPTEAARQLLPHAKAVFRHLAAGRRALDELAAGTRGRLSIGSFESVSVSLLPAVVAELLVEHPQIELDLCEHDDPVRLVKMVRDGELDVSFISSIDPEFDDPDLERRCLLTDPWVAVRPARHGNAPMSMAEIAVSPLVGHSEDDLCQRRISEALSAWGTTPRYVFRSSDNAALQAMVRAGMGIAVMPRLAVDANDRGVSICQIEPPIDARSVEIVWRRGQSQSDVFDRFVELAQRVATECVAADSFRVSV